MACFLDLRPTSMSLAASRHTSTRPSSPISLAESKGTTGTTISFDSLQLLLSLDVALELIHADRECLKRVETFKSYPGSCGHKVRDTIEELFILLLQAMSERHICPGFDQYVLVLSHLHLLA